MTAEATAPRPRLLDRVDRQAHAPFAVATTVAAIWGVVANLARLGFPGHGYDEPFYAVAGWRYVHGDATRSPSAFADSFDNYAHPPLAKYLFGLAELVAGHPSIVADRVVAALCTLATAVVLGLWLGAVAGRWIGLGAATLVAVLPMSDLVSGAPFRFGRYGYLDPVAELFAVGAVASAWWWVAHEGKRSWEFAAATGACAGLATAAKENGFLGVVGPVVLAVALAGRQRRLLVPRLAQALTAAVVAVFVFVLAYVPIADPFTAIAALWRFQRRHSDLGHSVAFAGRTSTHPPGWAFLWFVQHGIGWVVAVVCVVCALVALLVRRDRLTAWCGAALVAPLVFHMSVAGVILPFYWVMWMPALLALVALGIAELGTVAARIGRVRGGRVSALVIAVGCVAVLAVASLVDTGRMLTTPAPDATNYAGAVLARTPSIYLRLDERSGTAARDASGNGHGGSYAGVPTLGTAGLLTGDADRSVTLTRPGSRVEVAAGGWLDVDDFTATIWFRGGGRSRYLAARDDFARKVWNIGTDDTGRLQCVTYAAFGGAAQTATSTRSYDDGRAHLAACVRQGRSVSLYVDGVLAGSGSWPTFAHAPAQGIVLGERGNGAGHFDGTLDDFAFFGAALSAGEVADLYRAGTTAPTG